MLKYLKKNINYSENHTTNINFKLNLIQEKIQELLLSSNFVSSSNFLLKSYIIKPKFSKSRILLTLVSTKNNLYTNFIRQEDVITYCVIIELIHIATKIHDLIQHNQQDNIIKIFNKQITVAQAILIGDLVFTLAFEQMIAINNQEILEHFASVTKNMALFESKLSELNLSSDQILLLAEKKHWPLYSSIIYLISKYLDFDPLILNNVIPELELYITNINKINVINKIINKKIILNQESSNYIFNDPENKPIINLKNKLDLLVLNTENNLDYLRLNNNYFETIYSNSITIELHKLIIISTS